MTARYRVFSIATLAVILAMAMPLGAQRGGPGAPGLPPQSRAPEGRFPGFPPNAGVGQPETPGRPPTAPQPDANPNVAHGPVPDLGAVPATESLSRTPRLAERLAGMLGVEALTTEPDGFRNLGSFVAAVEVSNNVEGTTFEGLKARLLGDETTEPMSLGQAIEEETALTEPEAEEAAEQATEEAEDLIEETP